MRILLYLLVTLAMPVLGEEEIVLSDDGREVRLNADGSWAFVSEDRYATTKAGDRIRLRSDGQWEAVKDPSWQTATAISRNPARAEGLSVSDFVIESVRSTKHKNSRVRNQMVIDIPMAGREDLVRAPEASRVGVKDSKGRSYEISSINMRESGLRIIADDAPTWWGVKYFEITLPGAALGTGKDIVLRKPMADVIRRNVAELTQ
ncbi:MAG: hypothetical protein VXA40_15900 [Gammaproteobacteria bacterium]